MIPSISQYAYLPIAATALLETGYYLSADGWIQAAQRTIRLCVSTTTGFAKRSKSSKHAVESGSSRSSQIQASCRRGKSDAQCESAPRANAQMQPFLIPLHRYLHPRPALCTLISLFRALSSAARAWPPATRATRSIWPSSSTGPVRRCSCGRWTRRSWSASGGACRCDEPGIVGHLTVLAQPNLLAHRKVSLSATACTTSHRSRARLEHTSLKKAAAAAAASSGYCRGRLRWHCLPGLLPVRARLTRRNRAGP